MYLADLLAGGEITPVMIEINKLESGFRHTEMGDLVGVFRIVMILFIVSVTIFVIEVISSYCGARFNTNFTAILLNRWPDSWAHETTVPKRLLGPRDYWAQKTGPKKVHGIK